MKIKELRQLTATELHARLQNQLREYYQWQLSVASGKEKNCKKLRQLRRDIARVRTVLQELALAQSMPA